MSRTPPVKPRVHVHVPYSEFNKYAAFLRENRYSIELYLNTSAIDGISEADLHTLKNALDWEHTLSIHGPFMDLSPGAVDSKIAEASLYRYMQVLSFSEILKPNVIVFHSGYEHWKYAGNVELWLSQSLKTWRPVVEMAEKDGIKIAIENIVDTEPTHLRLLAQRMNHPLFGLCFDVGHRELFSKMSVGEWVEGMHPYIFELHLHDNCGVNDDHFPIGDGKLDFGELFKKLGELVIDPVYTLEAHSKEDAVKSINSLSKYL